MAEATGPFKQDFHKVLPSNRRMRRKVEKAKNVVLHLFSGRDQIFWQDAAEVVLCLDLQRVSRTSLTRQSRPTWLCSMGKVAGVVGGPVCRYQTSEQHGSGALWTGWSLDRGAAEGASGFGVVFEVARDAKRGKGWTDPAFMQERDPEEWLGTGEAGKGTKQPATGWASFWACCGGEQDAHGKA